MQKITMTLETVTPLFLAGASPRGSPEIRAPSIRGALRYWLRAALGGTTIPDHSHDQSLSELKSAEASVFGDTANGSNITIRAYSDAKPLNFFERHQIPRHDDPTNKRWVHVHAAARTTSYLFFSLDENRREEIEGRWCYPAGTQVRLQLFARRRDETAWQHACGALWLLTHLGGLGARSRRGAGALQLEEMQQPRRWPAALPRPNIRAQNAAELVKELAADLTKLRLAFGANGVVDTPTEFDILAPGACQIWVLSPDGGWSTWSDALGTVAIALRKGRSLPSRRQLDEVKQATAQNHRLPPIGRAGLGLPIVFYDRETVGTLQGDEIERRGSPLRIRVVRLNTARASFAVVLTWFNSRFAPEESKLALKVGKETLALGDLPHPEWMEKEFWPAFDEQTSVDRLEVKFQ